jgi:hypothetical protein
MPLVTIQGRNIGIHALIIGVSDYMYLPGDDDPAEGGGKFGMKKLKTPAFGAFRFLEWLKQADRQGRLARPLVSYEIILAPSPEERTSRGLSECEDDATTGHVIERIQNWRERVASDLNNLAVFYFSGHGIQRDRDDAVLMLRDFAEPRAPILSKSISFFEVFNGMAPSVDYPKMAETQFYFVDACRNLPERIKNFAKLRTQPVFDCYLNGPDKRCAPVFFATINDSKAFAEAGKGSYFNRALMLALECGAENSKEVGGRKWWPVTVSTLTTAITNEFAKFDTDQNFVPAGRARDCEFCFLDKAPPVDLTIQVDPEQQRRLCKIIVTQIGVVDSPFRWEQPDPAPRHPYVIKAPTGIHQLTAVVGDVPRDKGVEVINQKKRFWPVHL